MKKQILTKIIATIVLATTLLLGNVGVAKAALQANPNTKDKKRDYPTNWMQNFRKMEEAGESMGLDETLNEDLTPKESNNIDVHMMRSTEYGAIAILSASGYGNPVQIRGTNVTTTGNNTGMVVSTSTIENVAGGLENNIFTTTNARYYDTYTTSYASARVGDALGTATTLNQGCMHWHGAGSDSWINSVKPYLLRGSSGSIFSTGYYNYGGNGNRDNNYYCRGVAVCGKDF